MSTRQNIDRLLSVATILWAGEAEVVRTYWTAPVRTRESDLLWLSRQCFKEFWGSGVSTYDHGGIFLGVLKTLVARTPEIDVSLDRRAVLEMIDGLRAEFSHYCAFADAYDAVRPPGSPRLHPHTLQSWPEEDALTQLRLDHQAQHGRIGLRACKFTEGGYCTLFSEGMALRGRGAVEDKIADACALVYEDEFQHMLAGIAGIGDENLTAADWDLLAKLVQDQLRLRIRMRNGQFSYPLSEQRVQAIFRGEIEPIEFDYAKARIAA